MAAERRGAESIVGDDVNAATFAVELDDPFGQREERVDVALADVFAGVVFVADLADEDVSGSLFRRQNA